MLEEIINLTTIPQKCRKGARNRRKYSNFIKTVKDLDASYIKNYKSIRKSPIGKWVKES